MKPSKRVRPNGIADGPSTYAKRLCTTENDFASCFPPRIAALPHVTERIQGLAMSHGEAIVYAAASGNSDTLKKLLLGFDGDATELAIAAARGGHLGCIEVLCEYLNDPEDDEHELSFDGRGIMEQALGPAAAHGHYEVAERVWQVSRNREADPDQFMSNAFYQAIVNGHAKIAELLADDLPTWDKHFKVVYKAGLSKAISRGYTDAVGFLVRWGGYECDVVGALEEAIECKRHEVAEEICEAYKTHKGGNLMLELATQGRTEAIKYLYQNGICDDPMILAEARKCAKDGVRSSSCVESSRSSES